MSANNMGDMLRNAGKIRKDIDRVQEGLKDRIVEGKTAGGEVVAFVNGQLDLLKITISPESVSTDPDDIELLEDMILAAVAQGMEKAKELKNSEIGKVTGGFADNLSDLFS